MGSYVRGFDRPVARLGGGFQGVDEHARDRRHLDDGAVERHFVGLRRLVVAGELADKLERRGVELLVGRRRLEVVQRPDVAAHGSPL